MRFGVYSGFVQTNCQVILGTEIEPKTKWVKISTYNFNIFFYDTSKWESLTNIEIAILKSEKQSKVLRNYKPYKSQKSPAWKNIPKRITLIHWVEPIAI